MESFVTDAEFTDAVNQTPQRQVLPDRNGGIQLVIVKDGSSDWKVKLVHNADYSLPYGEAGQIRQL
jgi:hypothetical protein